ncbi:hypothetical protein ACFV6Y_38535 [Streptomyces massasporeus]|uniref:GREB1-related protein n=1 Tax=Streptomyces massasporeus TaxID=67324 RepID=UPI00365F5FC0
MFVTSDEQRAGLLVAVISGGRPTLAERPVHKFFDQLTAAGFPEIVWVVNERDVPGYEPDDHEIVQYPHDWAYQYASSHWMQPTPPDPAAGFFGAFPGREWACREAERRGCWGVLQLDDNINRLSVPRGGAGAFAVARNHGGLGMFADLIAAVALSTNGRMVGANLDAVISAEAIIARAGFCYSLFIEKVGEGREEWYGPFEDDITHAFQYGTRADGATAAVLPMLRYAKESKSKTGMRAKYNHERAVQLQRIFPESAKIGVRATASNGKGNARVFHTMLPGAIRNPLAVHDREMFGAVGEKLGRMVVEWNDAQMEANREKVARRVAAAAKGG